MAVEPQGPVTLEDGQPKGSRPQIGRKGDGTPVKSTASPEPSPAREEEATPKAQEQAAGQSQTEEPTRTEQATGKADKAEESFFDPKSIPDELRPAYQQMQAAFTKRMQAVAKEREKIEAYNAFMQDPISNLRRMGEQYGMKVVPANTAAQQTHGPGGNEPFTQSWTPQTWEEVGVALEERIVGKIRNQFAPVFENLHRLTSSEVERQLGQIDPNWRMYEDEMTETLKAHPSLANDVSRLYRISVPEEVLRSKYTQAALRKFEDKAHSARVQSKSSVAASAAPVNKKLSFTEAINEAKRRLGG